MVFGIRSGGSEKTGRSTELFIRTIPVIPFDVACALEFGRIAAELEKRGTPIGQMDTMIGAHALTLDLTIVTNNVKHFSRIRGLRVDNWL